MPAVTVDSKLNGDPIAMAQSPTCRASELPIFAGTRVLPVDVDHGEVGIDIGADDGGRIIGGIVGEISP